MTTILSVDGGGTKTLGVLYDEKGQELERWTAGPAALHVDAKGAWEAIESIVSKAAAYQPTVILGISGAETAASAAEIPKRISMEFGLEATIMSDIKLSYFAHHGKKCGVDVIAGTGSVVMSYTGDRFVLRGGWGYRLGDEGSAFGIVRAIVRSLLFHLEEGTRLAEVDEVLSVLGIRKKAELIQWTYQQDRTEFAGAARVLAPLQNALVQEAVLKEARALAAQAGRLLESLQEPFAIGLTGSVFEKNESYRLNFQKALDEWAGKPLVYLSSLEENVFGGYRYWLGVNQ